MPSENQIPKKSSLSRQDLLIGLIAGILIGLLVAFYFLDYFPVLSSLLINLLIALFIIAILGILAFTWYKDQILAKLFGPDFQVEDTKGQFKNLSDQVAQQFVGKLLEKFPAATQEKAKLATPSVLKLIVWSFTRSWALRLVLAIFVAIGGLLGAILLYNQNQLLLSQNAKIDTQNELFQSQNSLLLAQNAKVDTQNYRLNLQNNLIEADRRSSLVFLMSNILDKVDQEIKEQQKTKGPNRKYALSKPLISRIVALSRAFRPYRMMEGDTLSPKLVSPERGQLFIALMENNLDSLAQNTIVSSGNFSNAIIGRVNLISANLSEANLSEANLNGANLNGANLSFANLSFANLSFANLNGTNLNGANLISADLSGVDLGGVDLSGAYLYLAYLGGANLSGVDLSGAYLYLANLSGANLSGANLSGANLDGADLSEADLLNARVQTKSWLNDLKDLEVKGYEEIIAKYYVDETPQKVIGGETYYLIKEK